MHSDVGAYVLSMNDESVDSSADKLISLSSRCVRQLAHMHVVAFQASSPSIVAGAYLSTHIGPTCNTDILLRQAYCTA